MALSLSLCKVVLMYKVCFFTLFYSYLQVILNSQTSIIKRNSFPNKIDSQHINNTYNNIVYQSLELGETIVFHIVVGTNKKAIKTRQIRKLFAFRRKTIQVHYHINTFRYFISLKVSLVIVILQHCECRKDFMLLT